jgi:hypothetical protein
LGGSQFKARRGKKVRSLLHQKLSIVGHACYPNHTGRINKRISGQSSPGKNERSNPENKAIIAKCEGQYCYVLSICLSDSHSGHTAHTRGFSPSTNSATKKHPLSFSLYQSPHLIGCFSNSSIITA